MAAAQALAKDGQDEPTGAPDSAAAVPGHGHTHAFKTDDPPSH